MQDHRLVFRAVLAACLVTGVGMGCGGGTADGTTTDQAAAGSELIGMEFLLESAEGFEPVEGSAVSLRFRESSDGGMEFGLNGGCNNLGGGFTLEDGVVTLAYVSMTEMACAQELMEQDDWFVQFMMSRPTLVLAGDRLTLTGTTATLVFLDREVANPDRSLVGPTWLIDTFIEGEGGGAAASNVNLAEDPTVVFGEDGSLMVYSGCAHGVGSYTVDGAVISLGAVGYDSVLCSDSSLDWVDGHVQQVLSEGTISYEIDAARLILDRGTLGLSARTD